VNAAPLTRRSAGDSPTRGRELPQKDYVDLRVEGRAVRWLGMFLGTALSATAHGAEPQMLAEGSWVCATPEAHDGAVASEKKGQDPQSLEDELRAQCIRMTSERLEEVMAPFVAVLEQTGEKARVSFVIEVYDRGATGAAPGVPQPRGGINRQIKFTGWTAAANLRAR
jgi:DNA mismatch repair protein MutH